MAGGREGNAIKDMVALVREVELYFFFQSRPSMFKLDVIEKGRPVEVFKK